MKVFVVLTKLTVAVIVTSYSIYHGLESVVKVMSFVNTLNFINEGSKTSAELDARMVGLVVIVYTIGQPAGSTIKSLRVVSF